MTDSTNDLRDRISRAVRDGVRLRLGPNAVAMAQQGEPIMLNMSEADDVARLAIDAVQAAYVPPLPGSDRDALPERLRRLIAPEMPDYTSTGCQTARACTLTADVFPDERAELHAWAEQEHASCRLTRKQDMAACGCECHRGVS